MTTQYSRFVGFVLAITLLLAACGGQATQAPPPTAAPQAKLVISGAGGATAILEYLAEAYKQEHSDLAFEFLSGTGSGGGVQGALDGTLDLGVISRPPKDSELAGGIAYMKFATDRIAITTSPDVTVTSLASQQVKDIFQGAITNWSDVGGPEAPISVLVRDEDDTNTKILRQAIFGDAAFAPGAAAFTGEGELKAALASASNAIAYLAYSGIRLDDLALGGLVIDGQDPADLGSDYSYSRPAGVVYLPSNATKVQPFLDYILSPEALALLADKGIAPPE